MQLDQTRIAVRERGLFDTLDLALQLTRIHFRPLAVSLLIGAAPWAAVNAWLIGWMNPLDADAVTGPDTIGGVFRYIWTMGLLVAWEAPVASIVVTSYLGKAMFVEQPPIREVVREMIPLLPRVVWCQFAARGLLAALALAWVIDRDVDYSGVEMLLALLCLAVLVRRSLAPYLNEIVLLERTPMRADDEQGTTIRRRTAALHRALAGDFVVRAAAMTCCCTLLALALFGLLVCLQGIFSSDWAIGRGLLQVGLPLALWITVLFATVVRFLSYLDLRIRHEGWEVELRMRAEGRRLAEQQP